MKKTRIGHLNNGLAVICAMVMISGHAEANNTEGKNRPPKTSGVKSCPVVVEIDFEKSYSGNKASVFSYKKRIYQVTCDNIEISVRGKDEVLWEDERMEENLEAVVDSGDLKECRIEEIAMKIRPMKYEGKKVAFVIRREQGRYGLCDKDGCIVADHLDDKDLKKNGIVLEGIASQQ